MAVNQKVADATLNYLYAKLVDTVATGTAINKLFLKGAKAWGGAQEEVPIKTSLNTSGTSFIGADLLPTTIVQNTVKMTFDAKFFAQPTNLTSTDIALNETEMGVASLMERQQESDAVDMMIAVANQLYGDGTGNAGKDFTGIAAAIDDGTSVATYGGLSRSSYSSLNGTVTSAAGVLTLAKMFTMYDTLMQDEQQTSLILTTKAGKTFYESLLLPNLRYSSWTKMGVGADREGLVFREAKVIGDSAAQVTQSGKMWFINEDSFEFKALKKFPRGTAIKYGLDQIDGAPSSNGSSGLGFFATDWISPVNQMTMNKFIVLGGNLICKNPRYNGVLTSVTGI